MRDCSSFPLIAYPSVEPQKIIGQCGDWITLCGKGKHKVSYFLGYLQGPVTVWYDRESPDDEIYVYQNGVSIAAAPLKQMSGSFSFDYTPLDAEPGSDEVVLTHEGRSMDSRVHIHLLCPVDPCLPIIAPTPTPVDSSIVCGKQWHQSGFVKKNTIILGDDPGKVQMIWSVVGNSVVQLFQDKTMLFTMTPDRDGVFEFAYDPTLGDVYLLTQGIGVVDYIFTCPYLEEEPEIPSFEFVCDATSDYIFNAPQITELKLPVRVGTVDFRVDLVATAALTFSQNNVPFYVVSGHTGQVNFSYDYTPDKGKVTIRAEGYGQIKMFAKCPYQAPDPIPVDLDATCGSTMNTYAGYSNITMDMGNVSGETTIDFVITQNNIEITNGQTSRFVSVSGSYVFQYDKSMPLIVKARGNDFQMRMSCPTREPVLNTIDCGTTRNFDSYSVTTIRYGSTAGNTTITSSLDVSVYREGVLVGVGREITFLYPGTGSVRVVCNEVDQFIEISSTCPAVKSIVCGSLIQTFTAGDVVNVEFAVPYIRGHVTVDLEIIGSVSVSFRLGSTIVKTNNASEVFERIWNTGDGLRMISSGSGTFKVSVSCAVPIHIVDTETFTEREDCDPGETKDGVPDGDTFITATWTVTTYSDGTTITSPKIYDGICKVPEGQPMGIPRFGIAMFANRNYTGGPIASEITPEEASFGVVANPSPSGRNYQHWSGIQEFADQVMTSQFTITPEAPGIINTTISVDDFVYVMWDKRAALRVKIINLGNNFEVEFEGALWRNDLLGNYEGLPGYDPALPIYQTVQYDDGNGVRDWIIIRQETTTLAEFSPRSDSYSIQYLV